MTASSGVVLGNLAYLIGAVVLAFIGGLIVWLHHRQPKSVDANVESFHRGLRALAPDATSPEPRRPPARPEAGGLRIRPRPVSATPSETSGAPTDGSRAGGEAASAAVEAADDPAVGTAPHAGDPQPIVVDLSGSVTQGQAAVHEGAAKRAGAETG